MWQCQVMASGVGAGMGLGQGCRQSLPDTPRAMASKASSAETAWSFRRPPFHQRGTSREPRLPLLPSPTSGLGRLRYSAAPAHQSPARRVALLLSSMPPFALWILQHYRCSFAPLDTQANVGGNGYRPVLGLLLRPMGSTDSMPSP